MAIDFGTVKPGRTLYVPFDSFAGSTGASVTLSGLAVTDIEIYKDGSVTQRSSDNGYTLLDTDGIDFDGITGIHGFSISLADNSDAGFYAAGSRYFVVVSAVTVDSQTVSFVACTFAIGHPDAVLSTTIATLSTQTSFTLTVGPAEDDALNGMWAIIHDVASAVQMSIVQILDYTGSTKTVTLAAGATFTAAATDNFLIMGPMPLQPATTGRTVQVESDGMAHADLKEMLGVAQSVTDLKDFADEGYDPSTNKVQGVVLTDTVTNVTNLHASAATAAELAKVPKSDSNVTWNATAAAQLQSEAADALNAYDPPTNAEMEARTLAAAAYATAAAQSTAQTSIDDLPTNAELATALAAADDTVLAAIAAVQADLPQRITKNTALAAFEFTMVSSSDHVTGATGLTVTATRSLDGAAFGACANSVSEVSNGVYKIDLAAGDLNGNTVTLKFSATGADTRLIHLITQPT